MIDLSLFFVGSIVAVGLVVYFKILQKYQRERPKQRPRHKPLVASEPNQDLEKESAEDSQGDGLMSEGDIFFPEEDE